MHTIVFQVENGTDATICAAPGENLLELARKANVAIDAPCSGNASCGKCKIRLVRGQLSSKKSIHLNDELFEQGWRLACASTVASDAAVSVPDIASAYQSRLKSADPSSPAEAAAFAALQADMRDAGLSFDSGIRSIIARMQEPSLADTIPDNERLIREIRAETGSQRVSLPYFLMKSLPDLLRSHHFELRCLIEQRGDSIEILDVWPVAEPHPGCGLAIDLGTTTVSGLLVNLETGRILAKAMTGNAQIRYGADVINRIVEQQKPDGIVKLQQAVIAETILPLIDHMCYDASIPKQRIYRMALASNTTMNHLLLGIDANPLRTEPYIPAFFQTDPLLTKELGIELAPNARLHLAPNIGSYVGGDITAGTLASMMWNRQNLSLFIDLGTNGEIVFGNSEFLVSCACSAGPALEGGDISCGMRATDGAIESCTIDEKTMTPVCSIIGGQKPIGLCGSGLIDVVAELFGTGIINSKGKFIRNGPRVRFDELGTGSYVLFSGAESASGQDIAITEVDIDNLIRAKGAIFSATMTLLGSLGFSPADLEYIAVAGGIGSGINIRHAIRIGMFADLPPERYSYIGNSSLTGAYAMLASKAASRRLQEISRSMTYMELSTQPGYMDAFLAACFLPHTDAGLFPSVAHE